MTRKQFISVQNIVQFLNSTKPTTFAKLAAISCMILSIENSSQNKSVAYVKFIMNLLVTLRYPKSNPAYAVRIFACLFGFVNGS